MLVSGALAWKASANGFGLADQDAFATARGGAFVATADNASAIYYNPAGITQLEGANFRGGVYGIYLDPTYSPPSSAANSGTKTIRQRASRRKLGSLDRMISVAEGRMCVQRVHL